jgi:hypothetical protein
MAMSEYRIGIQFNHPRLLDDFRRLLVHRRIANKGDGEPLAHRLPVGLGWILLACPFN